MGIEQQIRAWCDAHPKMRDAFKQAVVFVIGYFGANWMTITLNFPVEWQPALGAAGAAALGWLAAHVNVNTTWPVVGAKAPMVKKKAHFV